MPATNAARQRIHGWGIDLDPKNRPGHPRERSPRFGTGAHWDEPERQIPRIKVLISTEHKGLTPVFGTACPPKGISGKIREYAFTFSEGRKIHWILLLAADRVDVAETMLRNLLSLKPNNPFNEMGLRSEFRRGGFFSRFGQHRSDVRRIRQEILIVLGLGVFVFLGKAFLRRTSHR